MSKPLQTPVPSSSIARLLDPSAAQRAVTTEPSPRETDQAEVNATPRADQNTPPASPRRRRDTVKRELVLSRTADETFTRLTEALRRATGTRLTASHAFRALMRVLDPTLPRLHSLQRTALHLPSNARGYDEDRDHFERALAGLLADAIAPPSR